eukprot:4720285-Amphidinium_carterae.1
MLRGDNLEGPSIDPPKDGGIPTADSNEVMHARCQVLAPPVTNPSQPCRQLQLYMGLCCRDFSCHEGKGCDRFAAGEYALLMCDHMQ